MNTLSRVTLQLALLALLAALCAYVTACGKAPNAPTGSATTTATATADNAAALTPAQWSHVDSLYTCHDVTATMPDGHLVYVCATAPRTYSDGKTVIDHYISVTPCPATPVQ